MILRLTFLWSRVHVLTDEIRIWQSNGKTLSCFGWKWTLPHCVDGNQRIAYVPKVHVYARIQNAEKLLPLVLDFQSGIRWKGCGFYCVPGALGHWNRNAMLPWCKSCPNTSRCSWKRCSWEREPNQWFILKSWIWPVSQKLDVFLCRWKVHTSCNGDEQGSKFEGRQVLANGILRKCWEQCTAL